MRLYAVGMSCLIGKPISSPLFYYTDVLDQNAIDIPLPAMCSD